MDAFQAVTAYTIVIECAADVGTLGWDGARDGGLSAISIAGKAADGL